MRFSDFLNVYKGVIVSVRDNTQSYSYKEDEEIENNDKSVKRRSNA